MLYVTVERPSFCLSHRLTAQKQRQPAGLLLSALGAEDIDR